MYQLSPHLDHLLQIKPISRFLHIPDIVPTISKVALSSFKDKISTIPHFLAHIVTQSQIKFSTAPCSSSARRLSHTFLLFNMSTFIFIINFSLCNIYQTILINYVNFFSLLSLIVFVLSSNHSHLHQTQQQNHYILPSYLILFGQHTVTFLDCAEM